LPAGNEIPVVAVASHDTASAVIASPLASKDAAYLSSGTWSLMGFESKTPYTSDAALAANITNEGGAEGRYRVLKNIMGCGCSAGAERAKHYRPARADRRNRELKACRS
jgi:rhamnulokinase